MYLANLTILTWIETFGSSKQAQGWRTKKKPRTRPQSQTQTSSRRRKYRVVKVSNIINRRKRTPQNINAYKSFINYYCSFKATPILKHCFMIVYGPNLTTCDRDRGWRENRHKDWADRESVCSRYKIPPLHTVASLCSALLEIGKMLLPRAGTKTILNTGLIIFTSLKYFSQFILFWLDFVLRTMAQLVVAAGRARAGHKTND